MINDNLEQQAQTVFKSWFIDFEPFRNGEFIESELGVIPIGWKVGYLAELIDVKYGKDHKKLEDGNIPVYGSGGIMRYVNLPLYSSESVLIPRKGTLNNIFYINIPFWSVDTMFYTIMKRKDIAKFIFFFMKSKDLVSMNAGSAVPSMTTDILNKLSLVIPPTIILKQFEITVSPIFSFIEKNKRENTALMDIRDTLLPKLMSGELSVDDI